MSSEVTGKTIALAEGRQIEELAQMLERDGATVLRCAMVSIRDAPDTSAVETWLRSLAANQFDLLILFTGEGVRRLVGFAERAGLREEFVAALRKTRTLLRGPKPVRALKDLGVEPGLVVGEPTTDGVIAALKQEPLSGRTVGVQLYAESNPPLLEFLSAAGARVQTVLPYVYAPAAEADDVVNLIRRLAGGGVDVVVFTSSPQVDRLWEVAEQRELHALLDEGLRRTRVAAVGPLVADALRERGARVDICPEQGFVMKNLVQQIKRALAGA